MIRAGVLGATGYAGIEAVRLLLGHPEVELTEVVSHSMSGQRLDAVYPHLAHVTDLVLSDLDPERIAKNCDVVFTALPHGASKTVIPALYEKGLRVIDLSGDFRYRDVEVYEKWYGEAHTSPELLAQAVYGLPELHRDEIKKTRLVGNPGCYTTCSILGLAPLLKAHLVSPKNIIVDAKSGVSGAGRGLAQGYHFCECTENMKAYKLATHRHTSEIEQEYSLLFGEDIMISFSPHLVPMKRGIYSTIYANLEGKHSAEELLSYYHQMYDNEPFIRLMAPGKLPESARVAGSNFVDIGLVVDERLGRVVIASTIDNLIKGAAGQAVQNMNLLFGLDETTGLTAPGLYL